MSIYLFKTPREDCCRSLATPLIFHMEFDQTSASTTDRKRIQTMSPLREQERPEIERIWIEVKEMELSQIGGSL